MAKKDTKKEKGPSIPSETRSNEEEWHTKTSDDEESYENEVNVFKDEEELNELDEINETSFELTDDDDAYMNEVKELDKEEDRKKENR